MFPSYQDFFTHSNEVRTVEHHDSPALGTLDLYIRADATTPGKKIKEVMALASEAGAIEVIFGVVQK